MNDPTLKERLEAAKLARQATARASASARRGGAAGPATITRERLARLAVSLRQAFQNSEPGFRKAYLRLLVDQVIVGDSESRLRGPTAALAKGTVTDALPPAGGLVPSFVWEWRAQKDS